MITLRENKKFDFIESINEKVKPSPSFSPLVPAFQFSFEPEKGKKEDFKKVLLAHNIKQIKGNKQRFSSPRALMELGNTYLLKNSYRIAINYFLKAVKLDPNLVSAYEKLALTYLIIKDYKKTEETYQNLIALTQGRLDILHSYALFKGILNAPNPDVDGAIAILKDILRKDPVNCEALNTYGFLELNIKRDVAEAKKLFAKVIKINENFFHAVNNYGACLLTEGNLKEAESYFKKVIEINPPTYVNGYQNLAALYIQQEKYDKALHILRTAEEKGFSLGQVWNYKIGWLLIMTDQIEEAIDWHKLKLTIDSLNDMLYNNLGFCFKIRNQIDLAENSFRKAISIFKSKQYVVYNVEHLKAFYNLGRIAIDKSDKNSLIDVAEDILKINPNDPFAFYLKGAYFSMQEKFEEAKVEFEKSLAITKDIPEIYPDYAFILETIEDEPAKAISFLEEGIEKGFNSDALNNNLAFAYIQNREYEKADKILSKYKGDNLSAMILATKGLLELRTDNLKKGNSYYESSLELINKKSKKILNQIWLYEKALYYLRKNDVEKSKAELKLADKYPESYMSRYINLLKEDLYGI